MKKACLIAILILLVVLIHRNNVKGLHNPSVAQNNYAPSSGNILFGDTFSDGDFDGWLIVDAPESTSSPSDWSVVDAKGSMVLLQDSNIHTEEAPFEGTYVYTGLDTWSDYYFSVTVEPDDNDGIFVIFRRVDDDNYYRFIMDRQRNYRRLEKKVGGNYTTLAEDLTTGYDSTWNHIQAVVIGENITIKVDHEIVFSINDSSFAAGAIGLGTWGNTNTYFDNVTVTTNGVNPYADAVVDANIKIDGNSHAKPWEILGSPEFQGRKDFLSIGGPGYWVILDMGEGEEIINGPGNDLRVYEIGVILGGVDEEYNISVGNSPTGPWTYVGQGWTTSVFDLAHTNMNAARYVRIDDLSSRTDNSSFPGSDIDAIQGLNLSGFATISAPTDVMITSAGNDVILNWDMVAGAVAYNIYGSDRGNHTGYSLIESVPAGTLNYTHEDAGNNNLFYVLVAVDKLGVESDFSSEVPYQIFLPLGVRP